MRKPYAVGIALIAGLFGLGTVAAASPSYATDGGASVSDGAASLVSNVGDAGTTNDGSSVSFSGTGVTTFASLTTLSADYNVTDDDCGGGSPRFSIAFGDDNLFVYLGPTPSFAGCAANTWLSTGNLVGSSDARFDLTQFGGPFYGTYEQALALLGSQTVTEISLVADGGWLFDDREQTVLVDNVVVNGTTYSFTASVPEPDPEETPDDKDACKDGGWAAFGFRNQGQCVSSVVSNRGGHGEDDDRAEVESRSGPGGHSDDARGNRGRGNGGHRD